MVGQSLQYGDQRIPYRVDFSLQQCGKLSIHVLPTGVVCVQAPQGTPLAEIKQAVIRRGRWLSGHVAHTRAHRVQLLPCEYVSGESHLYLGRRYLLKVRLSGHEVPSVKLRQGRFEIVTCSLDPDVVRSLLFEWYRAKSRVVFSERLDVIARSLGWLRKVPRWKLLAMTRQWGSCSPGGVLNLNPHLVKAPSACIDYVLLHELCHLKYHNHSKHFYRMLDRHMPEWPSVKHRLDEMVERILPARG